MTLDSITVVSNGLVNFQVRVSSAGGAIATGNIGTELIRSNPITVAAAGTHQVQVGLTLMPGTYLHEYGVLGWNDGSACTVQRQEAAIPLHRSRRGQHWTLYSLATSTSQVRVYYAYEWVVSEGCVGPIADGFGYRLVQRLPATAIPYSVDFNSGIPCDWDNSSATSQSWKGVTTYGANSINGSAFVMIDDDAAGSSARLR